MIIGIVGLPKSGKTTVFNAITGSQAQTSSFSTGDESSNVAMVKVPDPRIDELYKYFKDPKKIYVELKFMDFAPFHKGRGEKGFPAKHLGDLRACDALLLVVRGFEDETVPHPEDRVDPGSDAESLLMELAFADLEVVERRLERIDEGLRKTAAKVDRPRLEKEKALMLRLKDQLESGGSMSRFEMTDEEKVIVNNYGFLTTKPVILIVNVGDDEVGADVPEGVKSAAADSEVPAIALPGRLEMEIASLDEEERPEFMEELGIEENVRDRVLRLAWKQLGLIVFFTVGDDEVRAWSITQGSDAVTAASKIHSDIARGFIRAEVVQYDDFMRLNGMQGVKDAGLLKLEGKTYIVSDGEIVHFRFNV